MHDWTAGAPGEIPSPALVSAWVKLGMVPAERLALWAAHWLVDGYDGEALRTLAGYSGRDPHEVHDVLLDALADCATPIPDSDSTAAQVIFTQLARMHVEGTAGEKWILDKVDEIVAGCDYADAVMSVPLGQLYAVADEWEGGWGRIEQELKADVRQASAAQLAAHSSFAMPLPEITGSHESECLAQRRDQRRRH